MRPLPAARRSPLRHVPAGAVPASGSRRRGVRAACVCAGAALALACVSTYDRGTALYREGDLRGALELWGQVDARDAQHDKAQQQLALVGGELDRMLQRYEKRGQYYEREGRLAEALLSYRLALKLEPEQPQTLDHVQGLVRSLDERERAARQSLKQGLAEGDLVAAAAHAKDLETLNPFSPGVQVEIRELRTRLDQEVLRYLEAGKVNYAAGAQEESARNFERVLSLDPGNEQALGYISYIRRFEERQRDLRKREQTPAPAPPRLSQDDVLAEGHFSNAMIAEKSGDHFWALQQYEAALGVQPKHAKAGAAIRSLRDRLRPEIEELDRKGVQYFQDEDLQSAVLMWRRVLLIEPGRASTLTKLERAERMLARLEEMQAGEP